MPIIESPNGLKAKRVIPELYPVRSSAFGGIDIIDIELPVSGFDVYGHRHVHAFVEFAL